ncbi:MAG: DUF3576 domain-containing protein [Alphaproteobacteria bacterium]
MKLHALSVLLCAGFLLAACDGVRPTSGAESDRTIQGIRDHGSIFGDTVVLGGDEVPGGGVGGIAVNGYLWRASLDTVAFFPMSQVDAYGGVIITEWYSLPEAPSERYKMTVYILNRDLRADGVRVSLFKQARASDGSWVDVAISEGAEARIENAILTRARQLRINSEAILE